MHFNGLVLSAAMALCASAHPALQTRHQHIHRLQRQVTGNSFPLQVINNCGDTKQFGLFQINSAYQPSQVGSTTTIAAGQSGTIEADFTATGMRLSANADWALGDQLAQPQALFEFGYAAGWSGVEAGTAYDISIMSGSASGVGIGVEVLDNNNGSIECETKLCTPENCPPNQGWTNPNQVNIGSPADTVCYHGATAFKVTFCPSSS